MDKPVRIYASNQAPKLHIILGKLNAGGIDGAVLDRSFKGAGLVHELVVDRKDAEAAIAIIHEDDPEAQTMIQDGLQPAHSAGRGWILLAMITAFLILWYTLRR